MSYQILRQIDKDDPRLNHFALALDEGKIIAKLELLFDIEGSTINSIYVDENYRHMGYGTTILQKTLELIAQTPFDIPVIACFGGIPYAQGLAYFFEEQSNFTVYADHNLYVVEPENREIISTWNKLLDTKSDAVKLSDVNEKQIKKYMTRLAHEGQDSFIDFRDKTIDKDSSFAVLKDNEIEAISIIKAHSSDQIELSFIQSFDGSGSAILNILAATINAIDKEYPEASLFLSAVNPQTQGAADGIFKDVIEPETVYIAEWNGLTAREMFHLSRMNVNSSLTEEVSV